MTAAAYIDGTWRCYSTTNGITRHYLGCRHLLPKSAIAHVTPTYVSPLRVSGGAPTADPGPPAGVGVLLGVPSESPSRDSGLLGQARNRPPARRVLAWLGAGGHLEGDNE